MNTLRYTLLCCAAVAACFALPACSARNGIQFDRMTDGVKESLNIGAKKPRVPIHRIVTVWKAARGLDMKGSPCRGAAGQILFFVAGSEVPVKLEGEGMIVIYVFDDQGKEKERNKPIHIFRLPVAAMQFHLDENGSLGPSYHLFVPYTRKAIHQTKMTLAVRLQSAAEDPSDNGPVIAMSDLLTVTLPGPKKDNGDGDENLAVDPDADRKTKATTVNEQFFHSGRDRELREEAERHGTRVSNKWNGDDQTPAPRSLRDDATGDFGRFEKTDDRIEDARRIIEQSRRQRNDHSTRRNRSRNPLDAESRGDRGDVAQSSSSQTGKSFRLTSASGSSERRKRPVDRESHSRNEPDSRNESYSRDEPAVRAGDRYAESTASRAERSHPFDESGWNEDRNRAAVRQASHSVPSGSPLKFEHDDPFREEPEPQHLDRRSPERELPRQRPSHPFEQDHDDRDVRDHRDMREPRDRREPRGTQSHPFDDGENRRSSRMEADGEYGSPLQSRREEPSFDPRSGRELLGPGNHSRPGFDPFEQ